MTQQRVLTTEGPLAVFANKRAGTGIYATQIQSIKKRASSWALRLRSCLCWAWSVRYRFCLGKQRSTHPQMLALVKHLMAEATLHCNRWSRDENHPRNDQKLRVLRWQACELADTKCRHLLRRTADPECRFGQHVLFGRQSSTPTARLDFTVATDFLISLPTLRSASTSATLPSLG